MSGKYWALDLCYHGPSLSSSFGDSSWCTVAALDSLALQRTSPLASDFGGLHEP